MFIIYHYLLIPFTLPLPSLPFHRALEPQHDKENTPHSKQGGCRSQPSPFSMSPANFLSSFTILGASTVLMAVCAFSALLQKCCNYSFTKNSMSCLDLQLFSVLHSYLTSCGSHCVHPGQFFVYLCWHSLAYAICITRAMFVRPVVSKQPKSSASWELCSMRS